MLCTANLTKYFEEWVSPIISAFTCTVKGLPSILTAQENGKFSQVQADLLLLQSRVLAEEAVRSEEIQMRVLRG